MLELTSDTFENSSLFASKLFPIGPFIKPCWITKPIRIYYPILNRNLIGTENKERVIIYQWTNLINGRIYIGSASRGSNRILSYFSNCHLIRDLPIYRSILKYGHNNFCLAILEDLGSFSEISKQHLLEREQYYLNILFKDYKDIKLNLSPTAGTNLGYKHTTQYKLNMSGDLHYSRKFKGYLFSSEFRHMQFRNKKGINNPMFGIAKSEATIKKIN
jgi:group I intron endonuclease